jgi:integrase
VTYTLRHTWITGLVASGMDIVSVARLAGTSVEMIDRYYVQTRVEPLRAALEMAEAKIKAAGRK